ncbi:26094_t:CDS:2 [Gigaspora rosea]|nr:26094_t:CDS:2 [Gigaspora rosea]
MKANWDNEYPLPNTETVGGALVGSAFIIFEVQMKSKRNQFLENKFIESNSKQPPYYKDESFFIKPYAGADGSLIYAKNKS